MACPDENTIARIQAGKANAQDLASFHEHVDHCRDCMQLIEILSDLEGSAPALNRTAPSEPTHRNIVAGQISSPQMKAMHIGRFVAREATDLRVTILMMALTHLGCAFVLLPVGTRYLRWFLSTCGGIAHWRMLCFVGGAGVVLCLVIGPVLAVCGLYGSLTNRNWTSNVLRAYVATAATTLLMAPMSICLLALMSRHPSRTVPRG